MENKPIKFAIQNITNVSTRDIYIHSFQEMDKEIHCHHCKPNDTWKMLLEMRYSFNGTFDGPRGTANGIKGDDPTAMWILQMVHPCKKLKDPSGKCMVFMDNFYTCHSLGQALKKMTDGEERITGTCHLNNINKVNHIGVMKALALLEKEERGAWALIWAWWWREWKATWENSSDAQ